jgi:flavodoxin
MKALIVYYSRTGRTRKIADALKSAINADVEEIQDTKNREGLIGWLTAGKDSMTKTTTFLKEAKFNPAHYDVVVIGSPTWNRSVSVPIRTYIKQHLEDLKHVALFSTGDGEEKDALKEMEEMLKGRVFASMHLERKKEIDNNDYHQKVEDFKKKITSLIL